MVHRSGYFEVQGSVHNCMLIIYFSQSFKYNKNPFLLECYLLSTFKSYGLVPPVILQKDENADIVAREGDNVTLACDAKGHPRPQIVWRREDKEDILVNGRKG